MSTENTLNYNPLVVRAQKGDKAAWRRLETAFTPMMRGLVYRNATQGIEEADLLQITLIALWKAVRCFDPRRGRFASFAKEVIIRQQNDHMRKCLATKRRINTEAMLLSTEWAHKDACGTMDEFIRSAIPSPETILSAADDEWCSSEFIRCLTPHQKRVFREILLHGETQAKIAVRLGCSEKSIDNAVQGIRKRHRTYSQQVKRYDQPQEVAA